MPAAISFRDVSYLHYLDNFSCDIEESSSVLIITSREDESTALTHLATGLRSPAHGMVLINGCDTSGFDQEQLRQLRRQIAVVPSHGGLVSNLKLWENITLPQMYHTGGIADEDERMALDLLGRLGYSGNLMAMPAHLTAWEKRSAALVRALLCRPKIMVCSNCIEDVPPASRRAFCQVVDEFHAANQDATTVYLTSSPELPDELAVDRVIRLHEPGSDVSRHL